MVGLAFRRKHILTPPHRVLDRAWRFVSCERTPQMEDCLTPLLWMSVKKIRQTFGWLLAGPVVFCLSLSQPKKKIREKSPTLKKVDQGGVKIQPRILSKSNYE